VQDYTEISDESAWAVFGDSTLELSERWRLNGGLRFTREHRRLKFDGDGIGDPDPSEASGSWNSLSWKLGADYAPNDNLFYYANVSTGFKSGGVTSVLLPNGENDDYDPEKNTAYEVGMTVKSPGGRSMLRAGAFVYEFEDLQVTTTSVIEGIPSTVVDNAARVAPPRVRRVHRRARQLAFGQPDYAGIGVVGIGFDRVANPVRGRRRDRDHDRL
jgi:iron complex outermembrane receptor protein